MSYDDTLTAYRKALDRFREALGEPETALARDAAIKRFEFTFELSWKALQKFLMSEGVNRR